jgi:hypothetical protein
MPIAMALGGEITLEELRASECLRVLELHGYRVEGATPIRIVLVRASRRVFVPRHGRVTADELAAIVDATAVPQAEFQAARSDPARASRVSSVPPPGSARARDGSLFRRFLARFGLRKTRVIGAR